MAPMNMSLKSPAIAISRFGYGDSKPQLSGTQRLSKRTLAAKDPERASPTVGLSQASAKPIRRPKAVNSNGWSLQRKHSEALAATILNTSDEQLKAEIEGE
jgi:hypothetical protein